MEIRTRNYLIYGVIVLVQFYIIGLCYGNNQGYMTMLNYYPNKADMSNLGFICYIPPIEYDRYSSEDLTFGKSYATVMTDITGDMEFSQFPSSGIVYVTTVANVANFGVYYCKLQEDGKTTIVNTTKINSNAVITPSNNISSITANVGDTVTIKFDVDGDDVMTPFVWRKDGIEITNRDNAVSMTYDSVTVDDAGMYEMHGTGQRSEQKHSFINLIVRGCPRHKWNPPECQLDCEFCYNGGVCDDKTGQCICAPGFMGATCEIACNGNKHTWNCGEQCSRRGGLSSCKRYQFCAQDPYGCSCVTGYKGADCLTECPHGTFGAGCTQVCHCRDSTDTCNRYTGECPDGACHSRWKGSNCQECEDNYFGENCETKCPTPCNTCTRITGACKTCSDEWLFEPKCETGIFSTNFTPVNNGQMTDIYCIVKREDSSTIETSLQIDSGDLIIPIQYVDGIDGLTSYQFSVIANIDAKYYCVVQQNGIQKTKEFNIVIYQPPSYSGTIDIIKLYASTIEVSWEEWNNKTDTGDHPIIGYVVHYKETNTPKSNWTETQLINSMPGWIVGLKWETNYTIAISAVRDGKGGQGPIGSTRAFAQTLCGEPDSVKNASLKIIESEIKYVTIIWSEIETTVDVLKCSNLSYYVYTVYLITDDETKQLYRGRNTSFQFEYNAKYDCNIINVTVSNKDSEGSPISLNINVLNENEEKTDTLTGAIGGAVGGVLCVCIILGLIYILIIRKRRADRPTSHVKMTSSRMGIASTDGEHKVVDSSRKGSHRTSMIHFPKPTMNETDETYVNVTPTKQKNLSRHVHVSKLARYVAKNKSDDQLQKDFEMLPNDQLHPWNCASQECNVTRNRFKNIIPYDKHRVVLDSCNGTDYYNASYIDGYIQTNHYIASQGPNKASLVDFWRMIWQKEISIIVMLTNVIEAGKEKCKKYWPEKSDTFDDICVCLENEEVHNNYCIRIFSVWLKSHDANHRTVKQYHFTSWPDMGVPKFASGFLRFMGQVRSARSTSNLGTPLLVHCSAGVGRTGAYVVIDSMLDMIEAEQAVDVLSYLKGVREHRINMVQTVDQYIFIHDALVEFYLNGIVQISISNFRNQLQYLKRLNPASKKQFIEEEFDLLNAITPSPGPEKMKSGRTANTIKKNRFANILPTDKGRVLLMSTENYINASFLDGHKASCRFIATQMPLVNTVDDLWQAAYEWKASTIVMLNDSDIADPTCALYWPETVNGVMKSRELRIQLKSQEYREHVVIRTLSIKSGSKTGLGQKESILKQYQMLNWPSGHDIPDRLETLLEVYEMVESDVGSTGKNPVIVHCINGIGRTGVYCTVTETLDRMRQEETIDVFQAVKRLRANRPGLIENLDQYILCYDLIAAYIDRFATYSN